MKKLFTQKLKDFFFSNVTSEVHGKDRKCCTIMAVKGVFFYIPKEDLNDGESTGRTQNCC